MGNVKRDIYMHTYTYNSWIKAVNATHVKKSKLQTCENSM